MRPKGPQGSQLPPQYRISISPALSRRLALGAQPEPGGEARAEVSPREAVIVGTLLVHPELLQDHAEILAEIELEGAAARAVRAVLLDCAAGLGPDDPAVLRAALERAGCAEDADRLASLVVPGDRWMLDPHADPMRLGDALRQAITLHRRSHTLHTELRAAERALAEETSEANLAWMREVQIQLSSLEGAEADLGGDLPGPG
jgi:DNA primase